MVVVVDLKQCNCGCSGGSGGKPIAMYWWKENERNVVVEENKRNTVMVVVKEGKQEKCEMLLQTSNNS